jgi:hypothetical protein
MFSVAFDYGDLDDENLTYSGDAPWYCRKDPFSSYRSGFEVRTYRLCRQIIMFHHFPAELKRNQYPVSSTSFTYEEHSHVTYMKSAQHVGFLFDQSRFHSKCLLPLEFEYSLFPTDEELHELHVQDIDPISIANIPAGGRWFNLPMARSRWGRTPGCRHDPRWWMVLQAQYER